MIESTNQNNIDKNSKSLVICHLFYQDMWDKIYNYLKNLEEIKIFDLYITLAHWNDELVNKIKSSFNPDIKVFVQIVNNPKGADIHPFIHILNQVNLDNYDIVYKLHTKRTVEGNYTKLPEFTNTSFYIGNGLWFDFLYNAILGKSNTKKVIEKFNNDKKVGCIGFKPLIKNANSYEDIKNYYKGNTELDKTDYSFYYGTVFVIRANILKCIQNVYNDNDFIDDTDSKFSLYAWIFEALLGYIVSAQGYKFGNVGYSNKFLLELFSHRSTSKLYQLFVNNFVLK